MDATVQLEAYKVGTPCSSQYLPYFSSVIDYCQLTVFLRTALPPPHTHRIINHILVS
jgi:hypothetical protein